MTDVHWARHGENAANLSRTLSYRVFDGDLTDRGIAQARCLAEMLHAATRHYGLLVCSPLRRARQTAVIVSARLGLPVTAELDDLREVNVRELDGRADDSAWRLYEATLVAWRSGQLRQRFPGVSPGTSWQPGSVAPSEPSQAGRVFRMPSSPPMAPVSGPQCQR